MFRVFRVVLCRSNISFWMTIKCDLKKHQWRETTLIRLRLRKPQVIGKKRTRQCFFIWHQHACISIYASKRNSFDVTVFGSLALFLFSFYFFFCGNQTIRFAIGLLLEIAAGVWRLHFELNKCFPIITALASSVSLPPFLSLCISAAPEFIINFYEIANNSFWIFSMHAMNTKRIG